MNGTFDLSPVRNLERHRVHRFYFDSSDEWIEGTVLKVTENGDYWVHEITGRTFIVPHHAIRRIELEVG